MRGAPPLHLVLFAVGFALLAIPLAQLTFARPVQKIDAAVHVPVTDTPTTIRLTFAHTPRSVSLKMTPDGTELLKKQEGTMPAELEAKANLQIPDEGIELLLDVAWPDGTPNTAVTVELAPNGKEEKAQTRWSDSGSLSEQLVYEWKS